MFNYCKLCGNCLILDRKILIQSSPNEKSIFLFRCHLCKEYQLVSSCEGNAVRFEYILIKNFSLQFEPSIQVASIFTFDKNNCGRGITIFPLNELTHELAVQWVNKLKTFVIFQ